MAETVLAPIKALRTGVAPTKIAANVDGMRFLNDGRTLVFVAASGSAVDVKAIVQTPVDGQDVMERTVTNPGSAAERVLGPYPIGVYNDDDGYCHLTFSQVTGVTVSAISQR